MSDEKLDAAAENPAVSISAAELKTRSRSVSVTLAAPAGVKISPVSKEAAEAAPLLAVTCTLTIGSLDSNHRHPLPSK